MRSRPAGRRTGRRRSSRAGNPAAEALPTPQTGVFETHEMRRLLALAKQVAASDIPVLITGESGTGKELVARIIHEHSGRPQPFVPFNCAVATSDMVDAQLFGHRRGAFTGAHAHAPGVIRTAHEGTLLLDEIGSLDRRVQPKLLRFIENHEVHPVGAGRPVTVDVRIIAATNAQMDRLVRRGRFREDLYYRLNIIRLEIPPLRARLADIAPLTQHFLERYAADLGKRGIRVSRRALDSLRRHPWPGNVRELANEMRRLAALLESETLILPGHLPARLTGGAGRKARHVVTVSVPMDQGLAAARDQVERALIVRALNEADGQVGEAARQLKVSRKGLLLKRRRLHIDPHPNDRSPDRPDPARK